MEPKPYDELTDLELLELCVWRESRNQAPEGMFAVACSIRNRVEHPTWWGHDWATVILKPWQYSSFNKNDPNEEKWPQDGSPEFLEVCHQCEAVMNGEPDSTDGATNYYDTSITFPKAWGSESQWDNTLNIGAFRFWKEKVKPADLSLQGDT
jgi:hypothetical protein